MKDYIISRKRVSIYVYARVSVCLSRRVRVHSQVDSWFISAIEGLRARLAAARAKGNKSNFAAMALLYTERERE